MKGRVWKFGDDVDTDGIIPAVYLDTVDPKEMATHCMEGIDPDFVEKIAPGDIIVADKNFGCGSSREHAPIAIKAAGISCVIAKSFARIFYRNSINIGFPILESEVPKQLKEKIQIVTEELLDLIGKYKAKRNLWEVKLKANDDPRRVEFYGIMARLSSLDIIVSDLEYLNQLLSEIQCQN